MNKKAVVLFSGGLDSTTCLAIAKSQGFEVYALSFDYGQRHSSELIAAQKIAKHLEVKEHKILPLTLSGLTSSLVNTDLPIPSHAETSTIPSTYVPARNTIFLSLALGYAEVIQASDLFIGVSAIDYSGYPDCRPEYIAAFQTLAQLATKAGIEGQAFTIQTPLIHLTKAQTIQLGISLGVNYRETVSCYRADEQGACGSCPSSMLRKRGFVEGNIEDPTHYHASL